MFDDFDTEDAEPYLYWGPDADDGGEPHCSLTNCEQCGDELFGDYLLEGLCRDCLMDLLMIDDEQLGDYLDDKYHDRHNQRLL
jgi:hypothetical protein